MKTWTSLLAAGAILAFAVPAGNAALRDNLDHGVSTGHSIASTTGKQIKNVKHAKIAVGNGVDSPYYYLGNTQPPDVGRIGP
jgi:hypothetical protein